jgi:hypothetical protein
LILIARLIFLLWTTLTTTDLRQSFTDLVFALHLAFSLLSVQPLTVRQKPWHSRTSYPRSWLIFSTVMLHMSFVGTVHGVLDWDSTFVVAKFRQDVLFSVLDAWCPSPPPKPPDPPPWASTTSPDEWMSDHLHRVLHQIHFADEYVTDEATSLSNYLDLTHWHLHRVTPPVTLQTHHAVLPIQCLVSSVPLHGEPFDVLFDTGATHSFTFDSNDFISEIKVETLSVGGFIGTDAPVVGSGTVQWQIVGSTGQLQTLTTEAYYIPTGQRRLFCPQRHFQT